MPKTLYTIGHSNRRLQEFMEILQAQHIKHVIDIRTVPKSRHVPWFNQDRLKKALAKLKIKYTHMPALGGMRKTNKDSINLAWRKASFRGYADYMQTPPFFAGLRALNQLLSAKKKTAIMCAEAVPWRCHRSLIADAEIVRGIHVWDILSKTSIRQHQLTSFAIVDRNKRPIRIYYPEAGAQLPLKW